MTGNMTKINKTYRPNSNPKPMVTQFGTRSVSEQNYSKIVCIPNQALINLGNPKHLEVTLVMQNGEKFLKLSPIAEKKKGGEKN